MQSPMKIIWFVTGLLSLGCGLAGTILPLVPTTPFVLLSAFAFARSSPRLQSWLWNHPRFGPLLINWHHHGAISRNTKIISLAVIALTPVVSLALDVPIWALAAQVAVLMGVSTFILTRPSEPADEASQPDASGPSAPSRAKA